MRPAGWGSGVGSLGLGVGGCFWVLSGWMFSWAVRISDLGVRAWEVGLGRAVLRSGSRGVI